MLFNKECLESKLKVALERSKWNAVEADKSVTRPECQKYFQQAAFDYADEAAFYQRLLEKNTE